MSSIKTFYFSRILGIKVINAAGKVIGKVKDLLLDTTPINPDDPIVRPKVVGVKLKINGDFQVFDFQYFEVSKVNRRIRISYEKLETLSETEINNGLFLADVILDKQIVDLNGRKLVRVNDVRLVTIAEGTFAIAVDVGIEGLLRRIGIAKELKAVLKAMRLSLPAKFILWDDVETIDYSNFNIKLSKTSSKLNTLHPSDLADIIEDLGKQSRATVFSSLDEETAADVLEELETHAQINIIESLPVEKMADVLEKMPADEVADILDELEDEKAEMLLKEMEAESSQEVRELLEYPDNTVGSIMSTEFVSYYESLTVGDVLEDFRQKKPDSEALYNLFVTNEKEELVATVSLRDLIISYPEVKLSEIMEETPVTLFDDQKVDEIAEIISKYNLLAIPVVDHQNQLQGMVVINDVVEDLINERRTNR
ncbi:MAG: CBS domain-containing protein [Bacteroidota bacterium]|nr:CBS domain-containing protein [Bacteroidota bacterium]